LLKEPLCTGRMWRRTLLRPELLARKDGMPYMNWTELIRPWQTALWIFGISLLGGLMARWLGRRFLVPLTRLTKSSIDDAVIDSVLPYFPAWFFIGGVWAASAAAPVGPDVSAWVQKACGFSLIISVSMAIAAMGSKLIKEIGRGAGLGETDYSLARMIVKGVVMGIGALTALSNIGVSVSPMLTALGVGSLAVALAMQDTLSSLLAGIHIILGQQIKTGDYLKLDSGQEGYVVDLGWRSFRLRELAGNLVVVPNNKLAQAIFINYHRPEKDLAVLVQVGVSYDSDLGHVERVTCEVGRQIMKEVPGGVPEFVPFIRYNTFGDSTIGLTVILRGKEFVDRFLVTHEFMKRLHARYREERIEIAYPQRVLHMTKVKTPVLPKKRSRPILNPRQAPRKV
jgi:small-conductance mechanosensitive channel